MESTVTRWKPFVLAYPELYQQRLSGPFEELGIQVVVNVSDKYHRELLPLYRAQGIEAHWFPLNEYRDFGLSSLYAALSILFQAEQAQQAVLLHCAAGVNRSQVVADCYHFLRHGTHRVYPFSLTENVRVNFVNEQDLPDSRREERPWRTMLHRASTGGYLPPIEQMEAWLRDLGERLTHQSGFDFQDLDTSLRLFKSAT